MRRLSPSSRRCFSPPSPPTPKARRSGSIRIGRGRCPITGSLARSAASTVDAQDNIWVFQRPRSLTDDEKAAAFDPPRAKCCVPAPSVLVFNQAGDVVKSWGGPGDNLGYDWPLQEHGILVDNKGFVWLSGDGKGDNMVLKFTTDGKFVKQIGKSGPLTSSTDLSQFGQVAALEFDKDANEDLRRRRLWQSPRRRARRRHRRHQARVGRVRQTADRRRSARLQCQFPAIRQPGALHRAQQGRPRLCLRPHQQPRAGVSQGRQFRAANTCSIRRRAGRARHGA